MNQEEGLKALGDYFQLMSMNGATRIFATAKDLGIFGALAKEPHSAGSLAEQCGLVERPTMLLLEALASIGVVVEAQGMFTLTPLMHLLTGTYANLSDEYWDHLPTLLKSGIPIARMDHAAESETHYVKQVQALAWMMQPAAVAAARMLEVGGRRRDLRILDVGAGSAIWSLTLAQHDKGAQVTALDWPQVLGVASQFAAQMDLSNRFHTLPGSFHKVDLEPESFDLAIVANVTHLESSDNLIALFSKLRSALCRGGELVIIDVMPGQVAGDLNRTLYSLGLALRTEHGKVYSPELLKQLLVQSGYTDSCFHSLPVIPYTMGMIIAKRQ